MVIKDCYPKCSKPFGLSQAKFYPFCECLQEFETLLEPKQLITKVWMKEELEYPKEQCTFRRVGFDKPCKDKSYS